MLKETMHRTHADLVIRDERTAGNARKGFVWKKGENVAANTVDELTLDLLLALRTPQNAAGMTHLLTKVFAARGRHLRPDQAQDAAGVVQHNFEACGWLEEASNGAASCPQVLAPSDAQAYRPGWVPLAFPLDIVLSVTMACNLRCKHCGVSCGPDTARPNELTLDEIRTLLRECDQHGVREVTLTGGEITTRKDWRDILEATLGACYGVLMITNGVKLSDDDADFLASISRAKKEGFRVAVSLDGATPESHGFIRGGPITFLRSTATIKRLTQRGVEVGVGMTVSPTSAQDLPEMVALAHRLNIRSVEFHPVEIYGRAIEHSELFMPRHEVRRQMKEVSALREEAREQGVHVFYETKRVPFTRDELQSYGVQVEGQVFRSLEYPAWAHDAGLLKVCVDADGSVYPSEKCQGFAPLKMGTVREGGLIGVWHSDKWDFFRGGWTPEALHQCRGCPISARCATRNNRIIPHVTLGDPLAAMPECQRVARRWSAQ
ncbi:radical SAM protein [Deinococcus sp. SM5_A1]|uniref:radical SAM protein n=1 Tax=Deinococcus sp. SM5_A1 TaxID=3379094 RepID=UPI00385DD800